MRKRKQAIEPGGEKHEWERACEQDGVLDLKPAEWFETLRPPPRGATLEDEVVGEVRMLQRRMEVMGRGAREHVREHVLSPIVLAHAGSRATAAEIAAAGFCRRHVATLVMLARAMSLSSAARLLACDKHVVQTYLGEALDILGDPSRVWPCGLSGKAMRDYVTRVLQEARA